MGRDENYLEDHLRLYFSDDNEDDESKQFLLRQEAAIRSGFYPFQMNDFENNQLPGFAATLEKQERYLDLRNTILELWQNNCKKYLSVEDTLDGVKKIYVQDLYVVYDFLETYGFINFGILNEDHVEIRNQQIKDHKENLNKDYRKKPVESKIDDSEIVLEDDKIGKPYKVVVVGGGMSGLTAARQLTSWGYQVTLLEGNKRFGGRANTDFETFTKPVDIGGSIMTGLHGNPQDIYCRQLDLKTHKLEATCPIYHQDGSKIPYLEDEAIQNYYNKILDNTKPKQLSKELDFQTYFNHRTLNEEKEKEKLRQNLSMFRNSEDNGVSVSLGNSFDILAARSYPILLEKEKEILHWHIANLEYGLGTELSNVNRIEWDQDDQWEIKGSHCLIKKGYGTVANNLAKGLNTLQDHTVTKIITKPKIQENQENKSDVKKEEEKEQEVKVEDQQENKNKEETKEEEKEEVKVEGDKEEEVKKEEIKDETKDEIMEESENEEKKETKPVQKKIEDFKETYEVHCSNGSVFEADFVIVSVSLGVLKRSNTEQGITFSPSLPSWKVGAIENLGFGLFNKVVLEFDEVFWDNSNDYFGITNQPNQQDRGLAYLFWNLNRLSNKPILIALLAGSAAFLGEDKENHEKVVEKTIDRLALICQMKRDDPKLKPKNWLITSWESDTKTFGSYSYISPNSSGEEYDILSKNVNNIHFVGEATCRQHPSTVAGATISGFREAAKIDQKLNLFKFKDYIPPDLNIKPKKLNYSNHGKKRDTSYQPFLDEGFTRNRGFARRRLKDSIKDEDKWIFRDITIPKIEENKKDSSSSKHRSSSKDLDKKRKSPYQLAGRSKYLPPSKVAKGNDSKSPSKNSFARDWQSNTTWTQTPSKSFNSNNNHNSNNSNHNNNNSYNSNNNSHNNPHQNNNNTNNRFPPNNQRPPNFGAHGPPPFAPGPYGPPFGPPGSHPYPYLPPNGPINGQNGHGAPNPHQNNNTNHSTPNNNNNNYSYYDRSQNSDKAHSKDSRDNNSKYNSHLNDRPNNIHNNQNNNQNNNSSSNVDIDGDVSMDMSPDFSKNSDFNNFGSMGSFSDSNPRLLQLKQNIQNQNNQNTSSQNNFENGGFFMENPSLNNNNNNNNSNTEKTKEKDKINVPLEFKESVSTLVVQRIAKFKKAKKRNFSKEEFKHNARKLTHLCIEKEKKLKSENQVLVMNDKVRTKIKKFVDSYLAKKY